MNELRQIPRNFYKLKVGSSLLQVGSPGSGKSHLLNALMGDIERFVDIDNSQRPRRLVFCPGAAKECVLNVKRLAKTFDEIKVEYDLVEKLEEIKKTFGAYKLNFLVLEDFFLSSTSTFRNLAKILFQNLRHDGVIIIFTMQAVSHQANFSLLLGYVNKLILHASPANYSSIARIAQRHNFSPRVRAYLNQELRDMIKERNKTGKFDSILIDCDLQLAIFNFQTRPIDHNRSERELSRALDLASPDMEETFFLVPAKKLSLKKERLSDQNLEVVLNLYPKAKREQAAVIFEILRRNNLDKNINLQTLMFSIDGKSCPIFDLLSVVGGLSKNLTPEVKGVIKALDRRSIGLPKVRILH